jgi:hypothetical protein
VDDLTAFVKARLDEEEFEIKGPPGWRVEHWTAVRYGDNPSGRNWRIDADGGRCVVDGVPAPDAGYMVTYDPARMLREIAAKRAILARYERAAAVPASVSSFVRGQDRGYAEACLDAIRDLGAAWSDHPEYRAAEWTPDA